MMFTGSTFDLRHHLGYDGTHLQAGLMLGDVGWVADHYRQLKTYGQVTVRGSIDITIDANKLN
jgi:hypothetical protein